MLSCAVLFPTTWYDGAALLEPELPYVLGGNHRLVGGVELRVIRVGNDSCTTPDNLPGPNGACYAAYNSAASPFHDVLHIGSHTYDFGQTFTSDLRGRYGGIRNLKEVNYGKKGYGLVLRPGDHVGARAALQEWLDDGLLYDPGVRALGITFNLYNTNTRYVTVVRVMMEILETSMFLPSTVTFTVPVPELFFANTKDRIIIGVMVLYLLGWVYYVQKEVRRLFYRKPHYLYFYDSQNVFECVLQLCTAIFIVMYVVYLVKGLGSEPVDVNAATYVDIFDDAWHFTDTFLWGGVVGLMSSLKIFRYMSINKRMNTLWLMLARAKYDLMAFSASLLICMIAFAFMGQQAFGE